MVAPITSTVRLPLSPLHVLLEANPSTGLTVTCVAVFNQIRTLDRVRLRTKLGEIDSVTLERVGEAIRVAFGLTGRA
jgi:mRNA interferase MazF